MGPVTQELNLQDSAYTVRMATFYPWDSSADPSSPCEVPGRGIPSLQVWRGFQVAGFRHVIGTSWPSDDYVCIEVAKLFYAELCRNGTLVYTERTRDGTS